LTGKDENELSLIQEKKKKAGLSVDSGVTDRLAQTIVAFNGETDRSKIRLMATNMPARDSRALRKYIEEISPNVDMSQKTTCPSCTTESEVDVPLGTSFFWPDFDE
jgi:hypothetical protein